MMRALTCLMPLLWLACAEGSGPTTETFRRDAEVAEDMGRQRPDAGSDAVTRDGRVSDALPTTVEVTLVTGDEPAHVVISDGEGTTLSANDVQGNATVEAPGGSTVTVYRETDDGVQSVVSVVGIEEGDTVELPIAGTPGEPVTRTVISIAEPFEAADSYDVTIGCVGGLYSADTIVNFFVPADCVVDGELRVFGMAVDADLQPVAFSSARAPIADPETAAVLPAWRTDWLPTRLVVVAPEDVVAVRAISRLVLGGRVFGILGAKDVQLEGETQIDLQVAQGFGEDLIEFVVDAGPRHWQAGAPGLEAARLDLERDTPPTVSDLAVTDEPLQASWVSEPHPVVDAVTLRLTWADELVWRVTLPPGSTGFVAPALNVRPAGLPTARIVRYGCDRVESYADAKAKLCPVFGARSEGIYRVGYSVTD